MSTPGKALISKSPTQIATDIRLYNFDIDEKKPKTEHFKWLDDEVVPLLKANPKTTVSLRGTASKSGDKDYNREPLSKGRAEAVQKYLISKGATAAQLTARWTGNDWSTSTITEDEGDRAVLVFVYTPLTIENVSFRTDDWAKDLAWNDIMGLDTVAGVPISKVNLQVEASGAPRKFMPDMLEVFVTSRVPNKDTNGGKVTLDKSVKWILYKSPTDQPADTNKTWFRLATPVADAGRFLAVEAGKVPEVAYVVRDGGTSDVAFRNAVGWAFRGRGVQGKDGSETTETPDSLRLMQAAGVEVLNATVRAGHLWEMKRPTASRLIRSPADVMYYSGHGLHAKACLAYDCACQGGTGMRCWASLPDIQRYWKEWLDLDVLIIAGCSVLDISGPGKEWCKLLRKKGGPLTALLGYKGSAPLDANGGDKIATDMGKRIAAGLRPDQWVDAWLRVNGSYRAWNAVGMDSRGYWTLDPSTWDRAWGNSTVDFDIEGPAALP